MERGLTQAQMADKLGVSRSYYAHVEADRHRLSDDAKARLASLGCDLHWLITGQEFARENIDLGWAVQEITLDYDIYSSASRAVDDQVIKQRLALDPERRIAATMVIYRLALAIGRLPEEGLIAAIMSLCPHLNGRH